MTGLVSWWSRAAFRGLTELKSTADRQPVKPGEAIRDSSGSKSTESEQKKRETEPGVFFRTVKKKQNWVFGWRNDFYWDKSWGQCWANKLRSFLDLNDQIFYDTQEIRGKIFLVRRNKTVDILYVIYTLWHQQCQTFSQVYHKKETVTIRNITISSKWVIWLVLWGRALTFYIKLKHNGTWKRLITVHKQIRLFSWKLSSNVNVALICYEDEPTTVTSVKSDAWKHFRFLQRRWRSHKHRRDC